MVVVVVAVDKLTADWVVFKILELVLFVNLDWLLAEAAHRKFVILYLYMS